MRTDRSIAGKIVPVCLVMLATMAGRGFASPTYSIGGKVSGLSTGTSVTLLDNGVDRLQVKTNGSFAFPTKLAKGAKYKVTISAQPTGEICAVTGGSGTVNGANIGNVMVNCRKAYSIGGKVSGLKSGDSVTLLDTFKGGTDSLKVSKNGVFTFKQIIVAGATYKVTVGTQPSGEKCTVGAGTGTVTTKNVTNVAVTCAVVATRAIGGTLLGLKAGDSVTLLDNLADALTLKANGTFKFSTGLPSGARYSVTVGTQPAGELCAVASGSGIVGTGNVTTVKVNCQNTYTIGGKVAGLKSGESVTLVDNLAGGVKDSQTVSTNGTYAFKTELISGAHYDVTVKTQPAGEKCTVSGASGSVAGKNVTNVNVNCSPTAAYSIGGTASGLLSGKSVVLLNEGGDALTVSANGTFKFSTLQSSGSPYDVTVGTQPAGEDCTVSGGRGIVPAANVTTVIVACSTTGTFSIGGTVSGLTSGQSVGLLDNGGDGLTVTANGVFAFHTKLANGATYNVTVGTEPTTETCSVVGGMGTVTSKNVIGITVTCAPNPTYSIGGGVTGLNSGASVTLLDNGGDSITVTSNTTFVFPTKLATGKGYNVTVGTQPTGETCNVTGGSGTVASANITNVAVACAGPAIYTVGGSVSGLTSGMVTLLNEGGDSLGTGNGPFTFATKLSNGAPYDVTVSSAPSGMSCSVANGSGSIASANVTNVSVTCSSSTGGGGNSFWIPYEVKPESNLPMGQTGSTGLGVIASDKITTSPPLTWISTDMVKVHAIGVDFVFGSGGLTTYVPKLIVYSDTDSGGNTKVYGLDISDTTKAPTPVQISSLALDSTKEICSGSQGQTSLSDPTTVFVVFDIAATNQCFLGADTFEVVHYKDSSSTAPVTVSLTTNQFDALYTSGNLSGLVVLDSTSGDVSLYADDTFTSPKTLLTGVTSAFSISNGAIKGAYNAETNSLFYEVFTAATKQNPSGSTLYLIDSAGTTTQIFQGPVGSTVVDDTSLYFVSQTTGTGSSTTIYQVPLAGGTPSALFVGPATITTGTPSTTYPLSYELVGTNDSVLIYSVTYGVIESSGSTTLYNIPIGAKTTTPTTIATYPNAGVGAFLGTPSGDSASSDVLFLTIEGISTTKTGLSFSWSSVAFPAGGPYTAKPLANSAYEDLGILSTQLSGTTWRVKGITETTGGLGGGTVYLTDVGTLADTVLTTTGGGNYSIPLATNSTEGYIGVLLGLSNYGIAVGDLINVGGDAGGLDIGLAVDITKNFLYPITLANSDVDF